MKYIKTFESFAINEEELFGKFDKNKQSKISEYTKDILSGEFKMVEDLKKDIQRYIKAKPEGGLGSAMGQWMSYIRNINEISKSTNKPSGQLEDVFGKKGSAEDIIEEEVARVILKDRLVVKVNGKWEVKSEGRRFSGKDHTFGGGA
jgi:hypothetical protein